MKLFTACFTIAMTSVLVVTFFPLLTKGEPVHYELLAQVSATLTLASAIRYGARSK